MSSALNDVDPIAMRRVRPTSIGQLGFQCQMNCFASNIKCRCSPGNAAVLSSTSSQETLVELSHIHRTERKMGDTELSYYLPARESGVNDIYDDIRFVYMSPHSAEQALDEAGSNLEYRTQTKDGDGMALHQFANDFFGLLGTSSLTGLAALLSTEWQKNYGKLSSPVDLPDALESRLPQPRGKLAQIASRIDFERDQRKLIGGQTFPRVSGASRRTIVPTISFDENHTKNMLKRCKGQGVSISSALFAICNIAWAKTMGTNPEMPSLMYSALNLRPYLLANKALNDSYWFLAIGYFNIILPSFLPDSDHVVATFWHRARVAKNQSTDAIKNSLTVSRSREMARERGKRAKIWAKEDDDKARGIWRAPPPAPKKTGPPSNALIGLSLLGNLDGIYKHSAFSEIKLDTLTTGSRQRAGGMLLFGYTFVGKLWISLGYDRNGFDNEVVERFWNNVLTCTEDFLIN
ncbi:hypothetical protein H0H87_012417 [Tephrocybe sp. NHM501043]|nr:hypothetical protein H0H87_012417 [Tephrocybe sp. NHM501043]